MVAYQGNAAIINFMIKRGGADPDACLMNGVTNPHTGAVFFSKGYRAMHVAAMSGTLDVLRASHRAGAQVKALDSGNHISLMMACGDADAARRSQKVRFMLEAGANPNLATDWGSVTLHIASERGHTDTIDFLLLAQAPATL